MDSDTDSDMDMDMNMDKDSDTDIQRFWCQISDIGFKKVKSDFQYNVGLRRVQSDIRDPDIRLSQILSHQW
jgi:hypothetical protein